MRLLEQFEGVSFGDSLFGSFVLFPLQQRFDVTFRKVVWAEHPLVLRALSAPVKEVRTAPHVLQLFWPGYWGQTVLS